MLRVEFHDAANIVTMRLEGRFVGPFANDTRDLVTRCKIPLRLVVNLSEVTFVDAVGEEADRAERGHGEHHRDDQQAQLAGAEVAQGLAPGQVPQRRRT